MTHEGAHLELENSQRFSELNISTELKKGIQELGYGTPTDFQKDVFDNVTKGKHIAGTGPNYGKTLAFLLPILSKIEREQQLQSLVVCENAMQADLCAKECRALGRHLGVVVTNTISSSTTAPHILVVSAEDAQKLDLNSLDGSLHTIFFDGLSAANAQKVLSHFSSHLADVQLLLFGDDTVAAFKDDQRLTDAVFISNTDQPKISMPAKHLFFQPKEAEPKPRALLGALAVLKPKSALVTCAEREECELLGRYLSRYGYKNKTITEDDRHGLADALKDVVNETIDVVVCQSSLLSDHNLERVAYMFNYDMFDRPQAYEHTTQFNKQATGLTRTIVNLLTSREVSILGPIKAQCLIDFSEMSLPSGDEIVDMCAARIRDALNAEAASVELGQYEEFAQKIFSDPSSAPGLSLLLRNYLVGGITKAARPPRERYERSDRGDRGDRRERGPARGQDRGDRGDRGRRPSPRHDRDTPHHDSGEHHEPNAQPPSLPDGITRLYVTLGRRDGLHDLASLAQYLSEKSSVDLGHFSGAGMIRDTSAHIEVDSDVADDIIKAVHDSPRLGSGDSEENSPIVVERARQTTSRPHSHRRPQDRRRNFQRR